MKTLFCHVQERVLILCVTASVNEDIQKVIMFSTWVNNKAIFPPTLQHSCNVLGLKWEAMWNKESEDK